MHRALFRIIAVVVGLVGTSLLLPLAAAHACGETQVMGAFAIPMAASWALAAAAIAAGRRRKTSLGTRGAFAAVASSWIAAGLFGAVPLYAAGAAPSLVDAVFESVSGFTTTGATVLSGLEGLPRSVNLWRCQTHWLGGMGIIALTVAILPLLGVGGFQLIKAETTGPEKRKLTPKITDTAKALWGIYLTLTALQALLLRAAGMDWLDALSHAFSTVGTGGFSTRDASIAAFRSPAVEWICILFMLLASVNFSLYYQLLARRARNVVENSELRAFLAIVAAAVLLVCCCGVGGGFRESLRKGIFHVASIVSTTGFTTADYAAWGTVAKTAILALFFVGGCSGSTGGGVKVVRWVVLGKAFHGEIFRMLHPHGVFTLRIDGRPARDEIVGAVAAFFFAYVGLVLLTALAGAFAGLDPLTAFTGALSMAGNVGPAFGGLGPSRTFAWLPAWLKACYCLAMLAGRLELYTIFVFFSRHFWAK